MSYCSKCGNELTKNQEFCHNCGSKIGNNKKKIDKKWIFIFLGIVLVLIILFFSFNNENKPKTGWFIGNDFEKESCPHECCLAEKYKEKQCLKNYECISNECIAIDSDNDGLSDIEEIDIGTNPQLFDTDGDTLGDYKEQVELGTNPLKANTDNDRYNDNDDSEPLYVNSAKINVEFLSSNWNWKYGNIILAIFGGLVIKPDLVIAEPTATIQIKNLGDDYTNYVTFDIFFKISNVLVGTKRISLGRINPYEEKIQVYSHSITAGDIPNLLINAVVEQTTDWEIKIGNLDYERFL